jgi:hypothetical protein
MWTWIIRIASIIGGLLAIPEAASVYKEYKSAENSEAEAKEQQETAAAEQAKKEKVKLIIRLVLIIGGILLAIVTGVGLLILRAKHNTFKRHKKHKK